MTCTKTIRNALAYRPHTVPEPMVSPTKAKRWARATVIAWVTNAQNSRLRRVG